jgi:hypothetical protein
VLTEPVLVDLGMYINLSSGINDQMSPNLSERHTNIRTAASEIKGKKKRSKG